MDEKHEIATSAEGTLPPLPPESRVEPVEEKKGIALRIHQVRTNAKAHAQKATTIFNLYSSTDTVEGEEIKDAAGLQTRLADLAADTSLPVQEYVHKSKLLLQSAEALKPQQLSDLSAIVDQSGDYDRAIRLDIELRLDQLAQAKGLRKIPAAIETRHLRLKKVDLARRRDALSPQIQAKRDALNQLHEIEKSVQDRQQNLILKEVGEEISTIRSEYEQLSGEVIQDDTIAEEIRETYINQVLSTRAKELEADGRPILEEQKVTFYKLLRDCIDHRDDPPDQKNEYQKHFDDFISKTGFHLIRDSCQPLFMGKDKSSVQDLVVLAATSDISTIIEEISGKPLDYSFHQKFERLVDNSLKSESQDRWDRDSFQNKLSNQFARYKFEEFPDMYFWRAMRSSVLATDSFDDVIKTHDKKYYDIILEKSLSDTEGGYIDNLEFYPTPDGIRNLVIIAAADYHNYRTYHANCCLTDLRNDPDWKTRLDEAEQIYPSLRGARTVLEEWNYNEYGSQPDIQEAAKDLSLSIYEGNPDNPRLMALATEALTNTVLIDNLVKKGLLQTSQAETLKEAEKLLQKLQKETWERHRQGENIPHVENYSFHTVLRENLYKLLKQQPGAHSERPNIVQNFEVLSSLVIQNQEDLDFLSCLTSSDFINRVNDGTKNVDSLFTFLKEYKQTNQLLSSEQPITLNQENWHTFLMAFIRAHNEISGLPQFSPDALAKIEVVFSDPQNRDFCLQELNRNWNDYLKKGKPFDMPNQLQLVTEFINYCHGAGPLSQVEALSSLINKIHVSFLKETTAPRTQEEIMQGLYIMEERFIREHWSNGDKTDFYNISRDIIGAAPSLFTEYLKLFNKLNPSQLKQFSEEIYPLYRTKLVLIEKTDKEEKRTYDSRQLVQLRSDIRDLIDIANPTSQTFNEHRQKVLSEIQGLFKDRFGIIKIPETFTSEHIRSFTNISTYVANLHGRTPEKETVLGFYLSLMINDRWDDFRMGTEINPAEYLIPEKAVAIKQMLQERQRVNPFNPDNLGIPQEEIPEFLKMLQQETQNIVVGNVETIDVKLINIIANLHSLEDPDLYPNPLDKQRMQLLLRFGNKKIGSVVAKMYQQLANPSRGIQLTEEEGEIRQETMNIGLKNNIDLTSQTVKEHFQDGMKPLATIVNLMSFVRDTQAEPETESLRQLLKPSADIIKIFSRLGEDFQPTSGAMALSQDLSFLENLIVKREDEITPAEKELLTKYISDIRTQMIKLEGIYDQIKNKFRGLKQGSNTPANILLKQRLEQIDGIINTQSTQQVVTSTVTQNLNIIMENIRACLSCTQEGCNNDTNLTFGDMNKFYLYSQSETQQTGSISDELAFVEPITRSDGSKEMAFIFDHMYGTNTPIILESQVDSVLKKCKLIKQRFPKIKLGILISGSASSGISSSEMLLNKLRSKEITASDETVEVDVIKSAFGDHYVEFGGDARSSGTRQVHGILVTI